MRELRDSPVMSSPRVITGVDGTKGRSFHRNSSTSGISTIRKLLSRSMPSSGCRPTWRKAARIASTEATVCARPSTATVTEPCLSGNATSASHSGIRISPGILVLCSSTPVPASCSTAWIKYLVSVQRPAWSSVMTTSPASPVKPHTHSTCFQRAAGYSLL